MPFPFSILLQFQNFGVIMRVKAKFHIYPRKRECIMVLWSQEHIKTLIPALLVMAILSVFFRFVLGKKSLNVRMIPIQVIAVLLILLEIGKQVLSFRNGYDLYHIPLHYCSLFLFTLPAMAFYKGKHQQTVYGVTAGVCGALFLFMLIYPELIYSGSNIKNFFTDFFSMHTVAFHNLVMFAFLLIIALGVQKPDPKRDVKGVVWFMIGFCVVSSTMAQILKTNFANFYVCNIPPLENLRLSIQNVLGYWPTQILYIVIVSTLTVLFTVMSYYIYRALRRLTGKQEKHTAKV